MIASLGDIVFEVSDKEIRTFKSMKYNVGARYQIHNRLGNKPIPEFIAPDTETLSMNIMLSTFLGIDPRKEMKKLNDACRNGKLLTFILGKKRFGSYRWVITKISNNIERVDNKGNILSIEAALTLNLYPKR